MAQPNNNQELKQKVVIYLVGKKIIDPAGQQATIQKVLTETAPALVEADRAAGLSDEEIFLKHADAWFQANGDTNGGAPEAPKHGKKTEPTAVTLTAEETQQLDMIINQNAVEKGKKTAQSSVVAVLTDKPVMSQIYIQGSDLIPVVGANAEAQLKKYEENLVDTPENKAAFAQLKAAWLKKEPMQVYINPKAKSKIIGFKVNTLGENGTPETKIMSKEDAVIFLAFEVNGIIPARDDNSVGIKLRWRAKKGDVTSDSTAGTSVVAIINQKILSTNTALSVCTSDIIDSEVNENFRAKTAQSFLCVGKRKAKDGTVINVTTRLPGVTKVHGVKRNSEYVATFGAVGAKRNGGQSAKAANVTREAVRLTIKSLKEGKMAVNGAAAREAQAKIQRDMMNMGNPAGNNTLV